MLTTVLEDNNISYIRNTVQMTMSTQYSLQLNPYKSRYITRYDGMLLTLLAGYFLWFDYSKLTFFKNSFRNTITECQIVWIQIWTDVLSVLIWVQTVCKGRQKLPLARNELNLVQLNSQNILFITVQIQISYLLFSGTNWVLPFLSCDLFLHKSAKNYLPTQIIL